MLLNRELFDYPRLRPQLRMGAVATKGASYTIIWIRTTTETFVFVNLVPALAFALYYGICLWIELKAFCTVSTSKNVAKKIRIFAEVRVRVNKDLIIRTYIERLDSYFMASGDFLLCLYEHCFRLLICLNKSFFCDGINKSKLWHILPEVYCSRLNVNNDRIS